MASALGVRFLDADGGDIPPGGVGLERLDRVDVAGLDPRLAGVTVLAACDVTNPLSGPEGAASVYGPQKGAAPDEVKRLDTALRRYADVVRRDVGVDIASIPGGGAAGGLGAGLAAFFHAELRSGIDIVADAVGLDEKVRGAGRVRVGEGRLAAQTARGKAVAGIARRAKAAGVPVIAFAGGLGEGYQALFGLGIRQVVAITPPDMDLAEGMRQANTLLEAATAWAVRDFLRD
jgi:glycerate kinase